MSQGTPISRHYKSKAMTVQASAAVSDDYFDYRQFKGGMIKLPAALEANTYLSFKICDTPDGTYTPLRDGANAFKYLTVTLNAASSVPLPTELDNAAFFKVWTCSTTATDVNQTAARNFVVMAKG